MDLHEQNIRQALQDLESNPNQSVNAVAKAYNVPRTTLRRRRTGVTNRRISHEHEQRLTRRQETFLVEWILEQDSQGFPPSHLRAREMACQLLRSNGDTNPLGKDWIHKFIKRNPAVASVVGRRIEASRIAGTTQEALRDFYKLFKEIESRYNIQLADIWNMDEHGIALGVCTNTQVLASSAKARTYQKSPETREWVSIIETINPAGKAIKPLVIFKGKEPQSTWFEQETPDWTYTTSENGWTSNRIALGWLNCVFLPQTQTDTKRHRMLIMDGHGSHIDIEFMWICKQNKVQLVFLPPHSSHVLQPLDLGVFSPLKTRYRRTISELSCLDDAAPVKKQRFIIAYNLAREEALTDRTLRSGWKAAGIFPWNPEKGLKSSQVKQPIQTRQCTPPAQLANLQGFINTPKSSQELYRSTRSIQKSKGTDRDWCRLAMKAGKAISLLNTQHALDQQTLRVQSAQIKQLSINKTRKKITVNPNTRFANIEQIKQAQIEQAARQAELDAKEPELEAKRAAEAILSMSLQACQFEWQI